MYINSEDTKRNFAEFDELLIDNIEQEAESNLKEQILSIAEVADSYLDYGLPESKRAELEACIFDSGQILNRSTVAQCLEVLAIDDSDTIWYLWVAEEWEQQGQGRAQIDALNLDDREAELLAELIEAVDWYLDSGIPEATPGQPSHVESLLDCMTDSNQLNEGSAAFCLEQLEIPDSDESWFNYVAELWTDQYVIESEVNEGGSYRAFSSRHDCRQNT
ncbi:MAG: hypothetical protein QGF90_09580 [Gammaproteobacteria bacterium]|jgi:hypothetical protein|nr:hypothetical protein [Gammaproteobacteria bacterium]|tara:strand:- start:186 stop:842 length:657 start_codon:yes stop_codon:yes gene_type:complete